MWNEACSTTNLSLTASLSVGSRIHDILHTRIHYRAPPVFVFLDIITLSLLLPGSNQV